MPSENHAHFLKSEILGLEEKYDSDIKKYMREVVSAKIDEVNHNFPHYFVNPQSERVREKFGRVESFQ